MRRDRLLVFGLLCCLAMRARGADLLVYEPFNYTPGPLLGKTNASTGTNWLAAILAPNTTTDAINVSAPTGPLPALVPPPQLGTGGGNYLNINGIGNGSGASNRLAFSGGAMPLTFTSGTVYYSLLLRVDDLSGSNNGIGGFFVGLNNTANSATTTNPSVVGARLQARLDPSVANTYDLGIFDHRSAAATDSGWLTTTLNPGDTHFIVASYTFNTGSTSDDTASLWIDPDLSGAQPAATITDSGPGNAASDLNQIGSILVRQSPAPFLTMDELRVGTTWASVTSLPATITGDYNGNGRVDAADYVAWRMGASPNPGTQSDYELWRQHFGESNGASGGGLLESATFVPEPSSAGLIAIGCGFFLCVARMIRVRN